MHPKLPHVERDVTGDTVPETPGVLKVLARHRFSTITRDLRFADFTTLDGQYSQVHRQLRGEGFYVVGGHGIPGETGFHKSIESAVLNALKYHYPSPDRASHELTGAAGSALEKQRHQ